MQLKKFSSFFLYLLIVGSAIIASAQDLKSVPLAKEIIRYTINPLGKASYTDHGLVTYRGRKLRLTTFVTDAMGFHDTENIYSDPATNLPVRVERDVDGWFGHEKLIEHYDQKHARLVVEKFVQDQRVKKYVFRARGPIYNAITLPFYLRTMADLKIGWSFTARVPEKFTVTLSSVERVRVPAGKFEAYHFISTPDKFEIWISADEKRIPLKIRGKNRFGYTLYLTEYKNNEQ